MLYTCCGIHILTESNIHEDNVFVYAVTCGAALLLPSKA